LKQGSAHKPIVFPFSSLQVSHINKVVLLFLLA